MLNIPVVSQSSHNHRLTEKRPHRKEAFSASQEILEEVKKAQIWKTEYYEGEDENDAEWKENT